jgi:hypothetical protein
VRLIAGLGSKRNLTDLPFDSVYVLLFHYISVIHCIISVAQY